MLVVLLIISTLESGKPEGRKEGSNAESALPHFSSHPSTAPGSLSAPGLQKILRG